MLKGIKYQSDNQSVIELAPALRTITYTDATGSAIRNETIPKNRTKRYNLSFPYLIFVLGHNEADYKYWGLSYGMLFYRYSPLTSLDDYIYLPTLPNINDEGHICFGNAFVSERSLDQLLAKIMQEFFASNFNLDMNFPCGDHLPGTRYMEKFEKWAKGSAEDVHYWRKLETTRLGILRDKIVRRDLGYRELPVRHTEITL